MDPVSGYLVAAGLSKAAAATVASLLVNVGTSVVLSAVARRLGSKPRFSQEEQRQELQQETTLPAYRFVYGDTEAIGTPAPANVVKDGKLYGVWLMNSRPSAGPFTLHLDKREVVLTGDPYDFDGGGATTATEPFAGHVRVWIGTGDQTTPPTAITDAVPWSEANPHWFQTTDAWTGCTVVWLELTVAGEGRQERFPRLPPEVSLRGPMSYVWDPRVPASDLADPSTWVATDNQALCTLDALTQSPIAPFELDDLHLDSWIWAADVADEDVDLKAGGTEKRYRVQGELIFTPDAEMEDLVDPLVAAGGAELFRVGGRLGLLPATPLPVAYTLTDLLDTWELDIYAAGQERYGQVRTTYVSADRQFESADLGPWAIPGAPAGSTRVFSQPLGMVQSGTQAQRLRKIQGLRLLQQKRLSSVAPPDMIALLPGARVAGAIPGRARLDGPWQVARAHSSATLLGDDDKVALQTPFELRQYSDAVFAWDGATEEQDILVPGFDPGFETTQPPGAIAITSGSSVDLDTGGSIVPRIRFDFPPSPSASATVYEWQKTNTTADEFGIWTPGSVIDGDARDGSGRVVGYIHNPPALSPFDLRVRANGPNGPSSWVTVAGVTLDFDLVVNSAVAGTGEADFNITMPGSLIGHGVRVWRAETGEGFGAAVAISSVIAVAPGATATVSASSDAGEADFYVTPVTITGIVGVPAGPFDLTIL